MPVALVITHKPVHMRTLIVLVLFAFAVSCTPNGSGTGPVTATAYIPQYLALADVQQIAVQAAKSTQQPGKIYAFGKYIFQNDLQQGFHIIDNTDRKHPVKLAFLKVPYSTEIAIKGNYLYTNNLNDLVVFDISTIQSPRLVKRVDEVFPVVSQKYPPFSNVTFECPDPAKGIIVKWELKPSTNALCRR